jgi:cysteinyl-tRNA synthetase
MKLYNSLTRKIEEFAPINPPTVSLYTCGPTVYDHVHIGNLRTYIFEDILRRTLKSAGYEVKHVMNITDIDDKTITRSREKYPDDSPIEALRKLTSHFENVFYDDAKKVGIDFSDSQLVKATGHIQVMQDLIRKIPSKYITDDGIYFDITKYSDYGALVKLDQSHTHHRIQNDEYDKDHVADFALWKAAKPGEPSWDFEIDGKNLPGRPGWHIECSAMSTKYLGQPFDIHTGGVDLMFPHHENEIAQSRAAAGKKLANDFTHSEHLLVDGRKMSKSLDNFYTLDDIVKRGVDPMAFRLLILQAHYRTQLNFTWESLEAAQNRLMRIRRIAEFRHQLVKSTEWAQHTSIERSRMDIRECLEDDLNTPKALEALESELDQYEHYGVQAEAKENFDNWLNDIDMLLGLDIVESTKQDISDVQKQLIMRREEAREAQDWAKADELRKQLQEQGIEINDTPNGPIWSRT